MINVLQKLEAIDAIPGLVRMPPKHLPIHRVRFQSSQARKQLPNCYVPATHVWAGAGVTILVIVYKCLCQYIVKQMEAA